MLRHISYKFTAMFLLIPFLATSTGLNLYIHMCTCEQRLIATLFIEHKCHEEVVSACCSGIEINTKFSDANANCGCKTEHYNIKVNDLFNFTNPTVLSENFDFTTIYRFVSKDNKPNLSQIFISDKNLYIPDDSPPVKPVGRILVYILHQSKTPAFLS